jgi:CCR4-NOT transcription complex subunit 7/8
MYAQDSIDLLKESGIDFAKHEDDGIDVHRFGELMMTSGLVLHKDVRWVSFHSGYDFGYLLKLLTCEALPADEDAFFELMELYFPSIYDVKLMMLGVDGLHGGLQKLADDLAVARVGPMHQAGSDSLLTEATFFKLCEQFEGGLAFCEDKYRSELFGLGQHAYRPPPRSSSGGGGSANGSGGGAQTISSHAGMSYHSNGIVNGPRSLDGEDDASGSGGELDM